VAVRSPSSDLGRLRRTTTPANSAHATHVPRRSLSTISYGQSTGVGGKQCWRHVFLPSSQVSTPGSGDLRLGGCEGLLRGTGRPQEGRFYRQGAMLAAGSVGDASWRQGEFVARFRWADAGNGMTSGAHEQRHECVCHGRE
jgi:hypothetical protein